MTRRMSFLLIFGLAVLGWVGTALALAVAWVTGRFFATLLGWT